MLEKNNDCTILERKQFARKAFSRSNSAHTLVERFGLLLSVLWYEQLVALLGSIDWQAECDCICQPKLTYPAYYQSQNFHGIEGGYLNHCAYAAVTYDMISPYLLLPNEQWVRKGLINRIQGHPHRILDLGCGTGSSTQLLKRKFPDAEVVGLDLSPYMLVMANHKATQAQLDIIWFHGNAEHPLFPNDYFDLVTASLLFHETPPTVAQIILQEAFQILKPGGEMLILDVNQAIVRQAADKLANLFEEPYINAYAQCSTDDWLRTTGFDSVRTDSHWWIHQVTQGIKPKIGLVE